MAKTKDINVDMTKGSIAKGLISFTVPILVGNVFQQFYTIADTMIVGRTLGANALAAVGSTGTISFLVLGMALGLASGFTVVTSQKFGAKDERGMRLSVTNGIILIGIISILLTAISTIYMRKILALMNTPEDIFEDAYIYILIICIGLATTVFYNLFAGYLRAVGNSQIPLYFLLLSSGLNIVLDLVFIRVFGWGVAGAAIATVLSQLISALGSLMYILARQKQLVPKAEDWHLEKSIASVQLYIGLPMGLQYSITASGTMVMQASINIFGSAAVAAFSSASKCSAIFTSVFNSVGQAIPTYVGQNFGKGDLDRINKGVKITTAFSTVYSIVAAVTVIALLPYELRLFVSSEAEVLALMPWARIYIIESGLFYIPLGLIFIYRNSMQAFDASLPALAAGIVEMVTRVACAVLAIFINSYPLAVFCDSAAWLTGGIYCVIAYLIEMKKLRKKYNR